MVPEYNVTTLNGYTPQEQEMNLKLNELFEEWFGCLKEKAVGRFDPTWFVTDGSYPRYTEQKTKVLFIGREAHSIAGSSYIDVLYNAYKTNYIGGRHINKYAFHRRLFYIAYGLTHNCPPWTEIPYPGDITADFACPSGLSFAFMNLSKLSNETNHPTRMNWSVVTPFIECCQNAGTNFFNREIAILKPDIIITMNFYYCLTALGELETLEPHPYADRLLLKVDGRSIPLLNTYHFSAIKSDLDVFYNPVVEVWKGFQTCA